MTQWADGKQRCFWANPGNPRYIRYHDEEWGRPVHEDRKLFEMLLLETFQAGAIRKSSPAIRKKNWRRWARILPLSGTG